MSFTNADQLLSQAMSVLASLPRRPLLADQLLKDYQCFVDGYRDCGNYAEIPLTQGLVSKVSKEDLPSILRHKWYAASNTGSPEKPLVYARAKIRGKSVYLHLFLLNLQPPLKGDHRNHDTLDNRRGNLRPSNDSESTRNRRPWNKGNGSKYKGVWETRTRVDGTRTWAANITVGGDQKHLGTFYSEADAAIAHDAAARLHHGEFAVTNFPAPQCH